MHDLRPRLRRLLRAIAAASVALLALMTGAYAATGELPLEGSMRDARPARAALSSSSGFQPRAASSVTWVASNMIPGDVATSQITVTNSGTTAGTFTLTPSDLADDPAPPSQTLSSALQLEVRDVTSRTAPITLYSGTVANLTTLQLGRWQPGEAHVYSFTTTFPLGRPDALDNQLQDATTTISYSWDGLMDDESKPDA